MKKLLLFMILCTNTIFSQDIKEKDKNILPSDAISYFSILNRFGVISTVAGGAAPEHTVPTYMFILEGIIPVNANKFYLYNQFRTTVPLQYTEQPFADYRPIINLENIRVGGLLGFGGYVYDKRNYLGQGSSISINGGVVIDAGVQNLNSTTPLVLADADTVDDYYLNIGFDLNLRYLYSLYNHVNLVAGFDVGYLYAIGSGDPFLVNLRNAIVSYHTVTYGFTIGISF